MNKKIVILGFLVALSMYLIFTTTPAYAVEVDVDGSGVTTTTIDFDVDSGSINITASGIDTSVYHTGSVGQRNTFLGSGDFIGTYSVSQNQYGALDARINTDASSWASFDFEDYLDFDVLSGTVTHNEEGWFGAFASGNGATMNLRSVGSMYVWSEATNPYWEDPIGGNTIEKWALLTESGVWQGYLDILVITSGYATMDNSNIWGWGIHETDYTGQGRAFTNYAGGTRTITATGSGYFYQEGYGKDYLNFNGIEFLGGANMILSGPFSGGLSGTYSMLAK